MSNTGDPYELRLLSPTEMTVYRTSKTSPIKAEVVDEGGNRITSCDSYAQLRCHTGGWFTEIKECKARSGIFDFGQLEVSKDVACKQYHLSVNIKNAKVQKEPKPYSI